MPDSDFAPLNTLLVLTGAIVITYGYRLGGLLLAERLPHAPAFRAFMGALPGTILLSLVAPGILAAGPWGCLAALVTIWTAAKTKQTLLAMLAGMLVIMMQRHWF
jgi:uncharacterized membrane protein